MMYVITPFDPAESYVFTPIYLYSTCMSYGELRQYIKCTDGKKTATKIKTEDLTSADAVVERLRGSRANDRRAPAARPPQTPASPRSQT